MAGTARFTAPVSYTHLLIEVYMNTRSYDAALKSIERITHPGRAILAVSYTHLYGSARRCKNGYGRTD